ncbi:MAG: deoxyribonuclease IV [Phycisphaerae bacterium]|nr:deoxyribonuclease IV [Tepidisphaeraceae bacterium]
MFGSHLSIAGGMHNALLSAETLGMACVQVFTKNQQQWAAKPLEEAAVGEWKSHCQRLKFEQTVSHASYLINLASPDEGMWNKSIDAFVEELTRCVVLGIPYLVTHPGAHMECGEGKGLARVAAALDVVHSRVPKKLAKGVVTCLEITAGQGTCLGHRLEHLATIMEKVGAPERLGVCLDTAHLFAAGYDFRGRKYAGLCKEIEGTVGLDRVLVWHLNDSKKDLGSRVDRHEHIGVGTIGVEGFRPIVRDKRWKGTPKILETAKGKSPDGREWDAVNLEVLRGLM